MKGAPGGFTIVEVMIVLSISAVMLVFAITAFSGKQEEANFSQAVYDLQSQLRTIANDVSSQSVPGLQQYKCTPTFISGIMRPTLSAATPTGEDCVYLGQAIQLSSGSSTLYSYPIFGLRTVWVGNSDTQVPPGNISDTHPEPAIDDTGAIIDNLKLNYTMLNGLRVVSSTLTAAGAPESDIVSLYSSLQDNNTSGNEIQVSAVPITGDVSSPTNANSQIQSCIENFIVTGNACSQSNWVPVVGGINWNLCVTDDSKQALVSLKGTPTGVVTKLNMNGCS
jgi:prepilin-type N-terminal cleavage/methylation domain-containing protein